MYVVFLRLFRQKLEFHSEEGYPKREDLVYFDSDLGSDHQQQNKRYDGQRYSHYQYAQSRKADKYRDADQHAEDNGACDQYKIRTYHSFL